MKRTFIEWLQVLKQKEIYPGFETNFDWNTKTLHFKWIGR